MIKDLDNYDRLEYDRLRQRRCRERKRGYHTESIDPVDLDQICYFIGRVEYFLRMIVSPVLPKQNYISSADIARVELILRKHERSAFDRPSYDLFEDIWPERLTDLEKIYPNGCKTISFSELETLYFAKKDKKDRREREKPKKQALGAQ